MENKSITLLGSTGSIGTQTLDVVRKLNGRVKVACLSAKENIGLLETQIREFRPAIAAMYDELKAAELKKRVRDLPVRVLSGKEGIIEAACSESDLLVNAIVGNIGLRPTVEAIKTGRNIAIANKETLVTAGSLIMPLCKKHNVKLIPIDGEHSAIFQCLDGKNINSVKSLILTASGGPFFGYTKAELANVKLEDALSHPNWKMGKKITVDSAGMMNKGLEIIEARWLFDIPQENIRVLVHPQSIVHSMVEFKDGSVLAQMGIVDMRLPIAYSLAYPERAENGLPPLDLTAVAGLTFTHPDPETFPCLNLARRALSEGGIMPAVLNAANETAVGLFLDGKINFLDIARLIETVMETYTNKELTCFDDVFEAEETACEMAASLIS